MSNDPKSPGYVETEVEAAKRKVLAAYPKAEAMRTTTYDHKMWYVSTPSQGRKAGGRLSDYRLTEDAAWESAARHPYVASRLPAPAKEGQCGTSRPSRVEDRSGHRSHYIASDADALFEKLESEIERLKGLLREAKLPVRNGNADWELYERIKAAVTGE